MQFIVNEEEYGLSMPIEKLESVYFDAMGYFVVNIQGVEDLLELSRKYGDIVVSAAETDEELPMITFPDTQV